jgi:hypothetical protein
LKPGDIVLSNAGVTGLFVHPADPQPPREVGMWSPNELGIILEKENTFFSAKHYRILTSRGKVGWVLCYNIKRI